MKDKNVVLIVLGISVLLVGVLSLAFFVFFKEQKNNVTEEIKNGVVSMNYKSATNDFRLAKLTPLSNDLGKTLRDEGTYFDFSVSSKMDDDTEVSYEIALIKDETSTILDSDIMVYLEKESSGSYAKVEEPSVFTPIKKKSKLGSPTGSMVLNKVSLSGDRVDNYRLRIWVREGAKVSNPAASFQVKVKVYGDAK